MTEVIVYQAEDSSYISLPQIEYGPRELSFDLLSKFAKLLAVIGASVIIFSYIPSIWYSTLATIGTKVASVKLSQREVQVLSAKTKSAVLVEENYLPPFDSSLSTESRLTIPTIGVNTALQEATYSNYEDALKKGVWRVSDFGSPDAQGIPVILTAHRFGYLAWTNTYRRENSFFNLPKVMVGDTINIIYRQRTYKYEVYAASHDTEIKDYTADLILYTCESLSGPERIFVYAKLIKG